MRPALSLVLAGLLAVSTVAAVPTAGAATASAPVPEDRSPTDAETTQQTTCERFETADAPPDPAEDTLGWENGCWYNQSLAVTTDDGLNETELDAVVARSMARVEEIRDLEFERTVPVEVLSQEAYRAEFENLTGESTTEQGLHQNAKWEALFFVNESEDAVSELRGTFVNGTAGFYDPDRDVIRVVSPDPNATAVEETTLGHELVHALQDQYFETAEYERLTTNQDHAADGIVEGDAQFVEGLYDRRCGEQWECSSPEQGGGGGGDVNLALQLNSFFPYSEGSLFVQTRYDEGGWAAVDEVYDRPPASSEQVIDPERYPEETPVPATIDHTPSGDWGVLELEDGIDYATFGEASLYTMFWYASYQRSVETGSPSTVGVPYQNLFNYQAGQEELPTIGPYNFSHPVTDGWAGDRLVPYVTDESAETGETGYVWKLAWDTPEDAEQFHEAYLDLLEYRGADPVDGRADTYRIPEGEAFADAFYVTREGDTVVVVNGPTVADLPQVREGAAPEVEETPTATPTETDAPDSTPTATEAGTETTDTPTPVEHTPTPTAATGEGPGFGVVAALLALVALAVATRRSTE